jgi:hypothetical protein
LPENLSPKECLGRSLDILVLAYSPSAGQGSNYKIIIIVEMDANKRSSKSETSIHKGMTNGTCRKLKVLDIEQANT